MTRAYRLDGVPPGATAYLAYSPISENVKQIGAFDA